MDNETAAKIGEEAAAAVSAALCQWIDAHADEKSGAGRANLCALVGKALVFEGVCMIGTAGRLEFEGPYAIYKKCLADLQDLIREKQASIRRKAE